MEPVSPSKEYPRFGRSTLDHAHAPYAIVMQLHQLGLSEWAGTLLGWLGRYDGLEEHLHVESDQACATRDVLMRFAIEAPKLDAGKTLSSQALHERKAAIVEELLQLDFVRTIAYWGPLLEQRIVWNPLEHSWLSFLDLLPISDEHDGDECLMVITKEEGDPEQLQAIHALLMGIHSADQTPDAVPAPQPGRAGDGQADH
jgi:hypothetical protein